MTALAVAVGGGVGSLLRYLIDGMIARRWPRPFPLGTLVVNVTGSTALGLLAGAVAAGSLPRTTLAPAATGLLGGYTTFSTFTYETLRLVEDGAWRPAAWNLLLSGPLSFAGAGLGYLLAR